MNIEINTIASENIKDESFTAKDPTPPVDFIETNNEEVLNEPENGWQILEEFPSPLEFLLMFDPVVKQKNFHLYQWQADCLIKLGEVKPTGKDPYMEAICACNGSGKDRFIIAPFVVWFLATKKKSLVITTSASGLQLSNQTEKYIDSMCIKVNNWTTQYMGKPIFKVRQRKKSCTLSGSECFLFATDEKSKAEGYHPTEPDSEMAIIVNEAKSVSPDIYEALGRCDGFNYWLDVSTPGEPLGDFYEHYDGWENRRHISYKDCPHKSNKLLAADLKKYGEHHPYFRSKWLALFTFVGGKYVIPHDKLNQLRKNNREHKIKHILKDEPLRIGGDIALSSNGDESIITAFCGNKQTHLLKYQIEDATLLADAIEHDFFFKLKIKKDHFYIRMDDGGVGRAVIDILKRKGWNGIQRVLNQSAAKNKSFRNRGAEHWSKVNRFVEAQGIIFIDDDKLYSQLASRKFKDSTAGIDKLTLQAKKEMIAAGFPSPDKADATVLALSMFSTNQILDNIEAPSNISININSIADKNARTIANIEKLELQLRNENGDKKSFEKGKRIFGSIHAITHRQRNPIERKQLSYANR